MKIVRLIMACAVASPLISLADGPVIVRSASEGRIWQTVVEPSAPLAWPWAADATRAVLTLTNRCSGAVTAFDVARETDAVRGSQAVSIPAVDGDVLVDAVLVQYNGDTCVSSESARLAFIPGVQGGAMTVRSARPTKWRKCSSPAVFAYDAAWSNESAAATSATFGWSYAPDVQGMRTLAGASGYDAVDLPSLVDVHLTLGFDGTAYWTGDVRAGTPGFLLFIR